MPVSQVRVGNPTNVSLSDNNVYDQLGGKQGDAMVSELHSKYFTQTYRGAMWHASNATASPVAIPLFATNCTPTFAILNPAGNTTAIVPTRINFGWTAGTGIAGCIGYAYLPIVGQGVGTAAAVSTYTVGPSIKSGIVGKSYAGNAAFWISATIGGAVVTPSLYKWSNIGQGAPITSTASMWSLFEDFDGTVIIPPGQLWFPIASVAIAETFQISLSAYEIPWP